MLCFIGFIFWTSVWNNGENKRCFLKKWRIQENIFRYDDGMKVKRRLTWGLWHRTAAKAAVMRGRKPAGIPGPEMRSLYRQSLQVSPDSAVQEVHSEKAGGWHWPLCPTFDSLQTLCFLRNRVIAGSLSSLRLSLWSRWKLWLS